MEEKDFLEQTEIAKENEEIPSKNASNLTKRAPNEKKSNIIIAFVAGFLALALTATFIGASIYDEAQKNATPVKTFSWDTDRAGFYNKEGKHLGAGENYELITKTDSADNAYKHLNKVIEPEDSYVYILPTTASEMIDNKRVYFNISTLGLEGESTKSFITPKNESDGPNIGEVYFNSLYTNIGSYAFYGLKKLEKVDFRTFASGKQTIDPYAFAECPQLKDITLSENLISIRERAFENDTSLVSVTLPKSLKSLERSIWKGCSLKDIYYKGTKTEWNKMIKDSDWSEGITSCTIHFLGSEDTETI